MLECTSVWLCTAQGSYRLRPSVWLHSKVSFLCGRSCVMSGTFSWTTGLFLQQRRMLCSGIFFPTGRGAAALSLYIYTYIYIRQLNDSGTPHTPDTVSLCSSHQTPPKMPASVCSAALEAISFVVGIFVMGMIAWNALQHTQPRKYYKMTFFVGALLLFTPIYLLQVLNQLLDDEYSIQSSIVQ